MPSNETMWTSKRSHAILFVTSPKYVVISMTFNALRQADETTVEVPGTVSVTYYTPATEFSK